MNTKTIESSPNEQDSRPWYKVEITDGTPRVVEQADADVPDDAGLEGQTASSPEWSSLPNPPQQPMEYDATYAVSKSGDLIAFSPQGDLSDLPELLAHVAWYDAEADEFTVLEFVES